MEFDWPDVNRIRWGWMPIPTASVVGLVLPNVATTALILYACCLAGWLAGTKIREVME